MTFQPGANLYTLAFGTRPENIEVPHYDARAPTTTDILYPIGKEWVWPGNSIWKLLQLSAANNITTATWIQISNATGDILAINGTANQITASTTAGTTTLSIPAVFIAPGSIASTTTITAGTSLASTTSTTAGTTLTATLGNITATNGNLVLGTAGNKIVSTSVATTTTGGANSFGSVALVGGTATVATTAVTANSLIFLTSQALGTVAVASGLAVTAKTPATSFVITASQVTDTSTIAWLIVN